MCKFILSLLEGFKKSPDTIEVEVPEKPVVETEVEVPEIPVETEPEIVIEENKPEVVISESVKYKGMVILLDNGHASTTAGKRSPKLDDGSQFFEYEFNRDVVKRMARMLDAVGIKYHILVPEVDKDIALSTRAARANEYCSKYGAGNCLFISVHANAAGNGSQWMSGRGWSVYTTKGITKSDAYATVFWEEAQKLLEPKGFKMRKDMTDGDPDYEENFTVIYKTNCPSILTENLFYDNKDDVRFLMSDEGRETIALAHVNAIKRICS